MSQPAVSSAHETAHYDAVIIGSGAGGATLALELARLGKKPLVIEKGRHEKKIGTLRDTFRYYDMSALIKQPFTSREGVIIWRTFMAGGSTVVACANGVRCLEKELAAFGINLEEEFRQVEAEADIAPIDRSLLSAGSEALMTASEKLGVALGLMPKFINAGRCKKCGNCVMGCTYNAKWSALRYLSEAERLGAEVMFGATVHAVSTRGGKVTGVTGRGPAGAFNIPSDLVIVAAGGLATPGILSRSGIRGSGENFFIDMLVNTYGLTSGLNLTHEPLMALVNHDYHASEGFILSPNVNHPRSVRYVEMGLKAFAWPSERMLGIMTKIVDEPVGRFMPDGTLSKPVTQRDRARLDRGASLARDILLKAGADPKSILTTKPQGAHPGGAAAIGTVVNADLQTEIENLYVCDCSVLPTSPGLPPIVTIAALAKRLGKHLAGR